MKEFWLWHCRIIKPFEI